MKLHDAVKNGAGKALGVYRVMTHERRLSQAGKPFVRMELEDYSDRMTAYAWEQQNALANLRQHDVIEGLFEFRRFGGRVVADLQCLMSVGAYSGGRTAAALIPLSACPTVSRDALEGLVAICDSLTVPVLREFVDSVLSDMTLWPDFVASRASKSHHHAHPGGLLSHSVDVAMRCLDQCRGLEPHEAELVQIAGLFHDLGKVRTVGIQGARPTLGQWVHHEALTLEVLAPHLAALDRRWPEGGAALRHALTWYAVKPQGFARFVGADIVRAADGCDVAMERGKRLHAQPQADRRCNRGQQGQNALDDH